MTWIRISGITNPADAQAAVKAGADAIGFHFGAAPRGIAAEAAAAIAIQLSAVETVGNFSDCSPAQIRQIMKQAGLTAAQVNAEWAGESSEPLFPGMERARIYCTLSLATLFSAANVMAMLSRQMAKRVFDAYVVDSGSALRPGSTDLPFDWDRARPFVRNLKKSGNVIIAGGLTPENVARTIEVLSPWGVDGDAGLERAPGKKDHEKIRAFVTAARKG